MLLDVRKPLDKMFELPTPAEILRGYEVRESKAQNHISRVEELFLLLTETDKALYIPSDSILPEKLSVGVRDVEINHPKDFKRLALYVPISGVSEDPKHEMEMAFRGVSILRPHFGYGWSLRLQIPPEKEEEQLKLIPLVSCVDGLELYTVYVERAGEISEKIGQPIRADKPRVYLDTFQWKVPSRSKEETDAHLTSLLSLPTSQSGKSWMAIDFDHTCPDSIFKFKRSKRIRYFCDHIRAAYRYAQVFKSDTDDPITFDPFAIPAELFVKFHDLLRYRVVVGKTDKRNINEAEREYLSWIFIPYYLSSRRPLADLFRQDYNGVEDYLVKVVQ